MSQLNSTFNRLEATDLSLFPPGVLSRIKAILIKEFGDDVWRIFNEHQEDVIARIKRKVLFINVEFEVKWKHARPIIELIVGPEPV